jgi:hypothetical protein
MIFFSNNVFSTGRKENNYLLSTFISRKMKYLQLPVCVMNYSGTVYHYLNNSVLTLPLAALVSTFRCLFAF